MRNCGLHRGEECSGDLIRHADYIIDLGPGAADEGGQVVAKGTPEMVARTPRSVTAGFLAKVLAKKQPEEA